MFVDKLGLDNHMKNSNSLPLLDAISPAAIRMIDSPFVESYNAVIDEKIARASTPKEFKDAQSWRLRQDLVAICYDGNPDAPVVYLQANPSYGDGATPETHYQPHPDYLLSVAGSHIYPPTRDYYHDQVFRHLRMEGVSLEEIGRNLLKVELCPWASKKWPGRGELNKALGLFPSREPICTFVQHLVDRGAIFVIARAWGPWFKAVPALELLVGTQVFKSRAPVSTFISRGSYPQGWDAILSAMRA